MNPRAETPFHSRSKRPTLRSIENAYHRERRATWTELFFDVVYVVAISRLAHELKQNPTLLGAAAYVGLFVPVWWSWIGVTIYADRFDSDDATDRVLVALQMLGVAALAVQIHDGVGINAPGLALAYCGLRLLLILLYARAWRHIPKARPLAARYMAGFSLALLPWLASVFVPPPLRFCLWVAGIAIDLLTPLAARAHQAALPLSPSHMPERFGLFTIVVLGETVAAVVGGVAGQHWAASSVLTAVMAFVFAFTMGWLYFDNVKHATVNQGRRSAHAWVYIHLLLTMGLTATGAGTEMLIATPAGRAVSAAAWWIFCVATASCFVAFAVILRTSERAHCKQSWRDDRPRMLLVMAGTMLLAGLGGDRMHPFLLTGSAGALATLQLVAAHRQTRSARRWWTG